MLVATAPAARQPTIKIYDVPQDLSSETILANIFELNHECGEQGHQTWAY